MSSESSSDEDKSDSGSPSVPAINSLPSQVVVTVGTYDGVIAGWELKGRKLGISFASPVHGGSARSLCLASSPNNPTLPGSLLSTGYDEMLKTHDWHRRLTSSGEVRTPPDFGTPVCSSFAPPPPTVASTEKTQPSTHCIVGFSSGKLVIYKKRDWSVQHVLAGHLGGVESIAVHPSGKLALTGGHSDGKLKLWDLTKGRLSFVTKINSSSATGRSRAASLDPVVCLVWSEDGTMYGYCHGSHITVRDVATGEDWCDVELPSRVNQVALLQGPEGIFVAAACNDGSLPVLAVKTGDNSESNARPAIMAIEPVEGVVAGEERYKCIRTVAGYYVVTANSAGVVSLMDLQGAIKIIMTESTEDGDDEDNPAGSNSGSDDGSDDEDEEEMAVDIIDAVQLGSGARVTCLVTWACDTFAEENDDSDEENKASLKKKAKAPEHEEPDKFDTKKRKLHGNQRDLEMDPAEVEKARALVAKAKKMQKRKDSKRRKVSPGE